jgi:hypothetical protein
MHDWTPAVIGGGLLVSGMLIFANNYKAGLSGIAATAFSGCTTGSNGFATFRKVCEHYFQLGKESTLKIHLILTK